MKEPSAAERDALWGHHHARWRDPAQVVGQWPEASAVDPKLLRWSAHGEWWETLDRLGITLLVTREYEHLVLALRAGAAGPEVTYLPLPHPSGLAIDRERGAVHVASTRNPNLVLDFLPADRVTPRPDLPPGNVEGRPLVPVRARFYPGSLYLHDLALVGGELYGNAVGQNAVVRLDADGSCRRSWWPRCIETPDGPRFHRNYLQLNSIAAGADLAASSFTASTDRVSARRPGHRNFAVDRRGVIFSGATREALARGLTRPHSARLHAGRVWVDNSGYGEVGFAEEGRFTPAVRLPGWTRGLCFRGPVAFAGTSRVIPRFRAYAPGLDLERSRCGVHAFDTLSGRVLGSLYWPYGSQIFAVDWLEAGTVSGWPFRAGGRRTSPRALFYAFETSLQEGTR